MNDIEIKLSEMNERIKRLEDKVFNMWLDQYEPDVDISDEGALLDPEPYVPVAACSQEAMEKALKAHREWEQRNSGNFRVNDYYVV